MPAQSLTPNVCECRKKQPSLEDARERTYTGVVNPSVQGNGRRAPREAGHPPLHCVGESTPVQGKAPASMSTGTLVNTLLGSFEWTDDHREGFELEPLRREGDTRMDAALGLYSERKVALGGGSNDVTFVDLLVDEGICNAFKQTSDFVDLKNHIQSIPSWVDWASIARGQAFYRKNSLAVMSILGFSSLVNGFGAPKVTPVLTSTGYLAGQDTFRTYKRLIETAQWVHSCMGHVSDLEPRHGKGWRSIIRVRALHASVRHRLLARGHWNENLGVPINQEDMCVTLLSFQAGVLLKMRDCFGIDVSPQERRDVTHLWRLIGFYLGIREAHNPCISFDYSVASLHSMAVHLIHPNDVSGKLAKHIIHSVSHSPIPFTAGAMAFSRFLIGDAMADVLRLPARNWSLGLISCFIAALFRSVYVLSTWSPGLFGCLVANFQSILIVQGIFGHAKVVHGISARYT